jgi:hypothetical protein
VARDWGGIGYARDPRVRSWVAVGASSGLPSIISTGDAKHIGRVSIKARGNRPDLFGPHDIGCSGYYPGSNPQEMHCRGVAVSTGNFGVVARWGFWDGSNGFGWSKAYCYHEMEIGDNPPCHPLRLSEADPTRFR